MKRYVRPLAGILIIAAAVLFLSRLELGRYAGVGAMKSLLSRVSPYEPLVFIGEYMEFDDLHFSNLRQFDGW